MSDPRVVYLTRRQWAAYQRMDDLTKAFYRRYWKLTAAPLLIDRDGNIRELGNW